MTRATLDPSLRGSPRSIKRAAAFLVVWLAGIWLPAFSQSFTPIRVNAGDVAYIDSAGNEWSADTGYGPGSQPTATGATISGTSDSPLFQSIRYGRPNLAVLEYNFPVPNGTYQVKLLFAEIWSGAFQAGVRTFHVQLEGSIVQQDLDVFAEAGPYAALVKTYTASVVDGELNIGLVHSVENPIISAIEVTGLDTPSPPTELTLRASSSTQINLNWSPSSYSLGVAAYEVERCEGADCGDFAVVATPVDTLYGDSGLSPATTYRYRVRAIGTENTYGPYTSVKSITTTAGVAFAPMIRVNVGGESYTDSASNVWSADTGFNNVGNATTVGATISGTSDSLLYQSLRWREPAVDPELEYAFAVPNGAYQVKLHFAEIYPGVFYVGGRVFNVEIEGSTVLPNLDVYAEVGGYAALVKTVTTNVSDGVLNLRFAHGLAQHPFVSAIEILQTSNLDVTAPEAITDLSATATSDTQVSLSWSAVADNIGVAGYVIERCAGESCTNFVEIATATSTSFDDPGLMPATSYQYRVRAFDAAANLGAHSNVAAVVTQSGVGVDTEPPSPPADLTAVVTEESAVQLQWTASIDGVGVTNYRVERCVGAGCTDFVEIAAPAGAAFTDTEIQTLTTYRYRVRAEDAAGNLSDYSEHCETDGIGAGVDTEPPSPPADLTAAVTEAAAVQLQWSASIDGSGVTNYRVERCAGEDCTDFVEIAAPADAAFTDTDIQTLTTYRYRVRAEDAAGNLSGYSDIASVTVSADSEPST